MGRATAAPLRQQAVRSRKLLAAVRTLREAHGVRAAASDEELLYAVARGEREALAMLYDRHGALLFALARRIVRDERDAEDLVHDLFIEAWQRAGDYDPARGSVRTWLLVRLRSRALDRVRTAAARQRTLVVEATEPQAFDESRVGTDHARLHAALSSLSNEQRSVLELGYFEGMSSQEIADALSIPIGTVKSRVAAALAQLRRAFAPRRIEEGGP